MIHFCAEWLVVHYDYVVIVVSGSYGCLHSILQFTYIQPVSWYLSTTWLVLKSNISQTLMIYEIGHCVHSPYCTDVFPAPPILWGQFQGITDSYGSCLYCHWSWSKHTALQGSGLTILCDLVIVCDNFPEGYCDTDYRPWLFPDVKIPWKPRTFLKIGLYRMFFQQNTRLSVEIPDGVPFWKQQQRPPQCWC